jgi:adenylate cyclase
MFHIGINSGSMLAGNIGAADRMGYTVMGKEVNVAARLSSSAKAGQILLSDATYDAIPKPGPIQCDPHGPMTLRGAMQPLMTYSVLLDMAKHQHFITSKVGQLFKHLEAIL